MKDKPAKKPKRSTNDTAPPKVLDTDVSPTLPDNALEIGLASIAPNVAVLHDTEGQPAVKK